MSIYCTVWCSQVLTLKLMVANFTKSGQKMFLISVVHVTTLSFTIMNIGRNIGEKNKTLPIALKNEELEEE